MSFKKIVSNLIRRGTNFVKRYFSILVSWIRFNFKLISGFGDDKAYILFSHNANGEGGASVVLFDYAHYLQKHGNLVIILTDRGGNLIKSARLSGIYCYEMGFLYKRYISKISKISIKGFLVCTLGCMKYVERLNNLKNKNVIWWIHEEDNLLIRYAPKISHTLRTNVSIMCGSNRIKETLKRLRPDLKMGVMYYGCYDQVNKYKSALQSQNIDNQNEYQFIITVIGRLDKRKNQMQVISALKMLPAEVQSKIRLDLLTGSWDHDYRLKIENEIAATDLKVNIYGPVPGEKLYLTYVNSNLIICPSVNDPLPVVITSAMMYGVEYVVSSETGQASLITNGVNGWVYDVHKTKDLSEIIEGYVNNSIPKVGAEARNLFLHNFSFDNLNRSVNKIFDR